MSAEYSEAGVASRICYRLPGMSWFENVIILSITSHMLTTFWTLMLILATSVRGLRAENSRRQALADSLLLRNKTGPKSDLHSSFGSVAVRRLHTWAPAQQKNKLTPPAAHLSWQDHMSVWRASVCHSHTAAPWPSTPSARGSGSRHTGRLTERGGDSGVGQYEFRGCCRSNVCFRSNTYVEILAP